MRHRLRFFANWAVLTGILGLGAMVAASMPIEVQSAARSAEWAPETLCLLLLDDEPGVRERQMLIVAKRLGSDSEQQLRTLVNALPNISPEQRLPLAEMTFPALKRRPRDELMRLLDTIRALVTADGKVSIYEYALARMLEVMINDAIAPGAKRSGRKSLKSRTRQANELLMVVAHLGQQKDTAAAEKSWQAGMQITGLTTNEFKPGNWQQVLDENLSDLDQLAPPAEEVLLRALLATISYDQEINLIEAEVLRAICASLHIPLPMMDLK